LLWAALLCAAWSAVAT